MAVYFKYKSAKDYDSIPILDQFISVGNLKLKIFESKRFGRGKDFDLLITNAQTNEDHVDQDTLIPKNTSVLIRRVPGLPRLPIVIPCLTEPKLDQAQVCEEDNTVVKGESIAAKNYQDIDYDDFGDDIYAIPKLIPNHSGNPVLNAPTNSINDEETKIKNLIDTPDLGRHLHSSIGYGFGRGGMEWKKPPRGYVCHRCNEPGHFIQHCPTNGDPNYDIKKVKPPTKSNDVASSKEVQGFSSSSSSSKRSFSNIPPELHCPLCKGLIKDAVIASKCCFSSFCDKCIREHIISNSICVCGARNILADTLLPNMTLRDTINRINKSNSSSSVHGVSAPRVQDMVSEHNSLPKVPFPSESAAVKVEVLSVPSQKGETSRALKTVEECPIAVGEAVKMKKRKKPSMPFDGAAVNKRWIVAQDHVVAENYMLTMNAAAYHPHWTGMQYTSYVHSPIDIQFGHPVLPRATPPLGQ
ncbi:E3 ubiquitin ligase PARAQUAT TOLERANCE 3-like [Nicotiana sylvestris]|uniref:E3 ubiquitin ligase PARAQUAT TOLERANCE 3-like n=1 Tax=Nicotiana sylvestris TaxID=4096 RepID=UPI00388CC83F